MKNKQKVDRSGYLFDNRALAALIAPLIIEQFLLVFMAAANSMLVARTGEAAVSAVALVDNILILLASVFAALATGGAVIVGQYLGQKRHAEARKASNQLIWTVMFLGLVVTLILYLMRSIILERVFGQLEADVVGHARAYINITAAAIPFIAINNGGVAIFRVMGKTKISMMMSIMMNIISLVLSVVLVFVFDLGAIGIGISLLVSRLSASLIGVVLLLNRKRLIYLERTIRFKPDKVMIKRILQIGIPNSFENSMFQLGKLLVLGLVATFGTYALAANAVAHSIALFQMLPGLAVMLAVPVVVSRCVGIGDYEQAKYYTKKLMAITYVTMWVSNAIIFLLMPTLLGWYNLSDLTAQTAARIIILHGVCSMIFWPFSFILPGTFRASGDVNYSMIVSVISMWVFRIVCSYVIGRYLGFGVFGVWIAMIIDWCFRSLCFTVRYFGGKWKREALV